MTAQSFLVFLSLAAMTLLPSAWAQAPSNTQQPLPARSINLTAEQTHMIKEIVLKEMKVPAVSRTEPVKIGDPAPDQVELHGFSDILVERVPAIKTHKFFVIGDRIVIVDPKDKVIADVLE